MMSRFGVNDVNAKIAYLTNRGLPKRYRKEPPLKATRPLYLRDRVRSSGRAGLESGVEGCSNEMSSLMDCLQNNDFMDAKCTEELAKLVECDKRFAKAKEARKDSIERGEAVGGMLHASTINRELAKYPTRPNKEALISQRNLLNTLPSHRTKPVPHKSKWNPSPKYGNGLTVPDKGTEGRE